MTGGHPGAAMPGIATAPQSGQAGRRKHAEEALPAYEEPSHAAWHGSEQQQELSSQVNALCTRLGSAGAQPESLWRALLKQAATLRSIAARQEQQVRELHEQHEAKAAAKATAAAAEAAAKLAAAQAGATTNQNEDLAGAPPPAAPPAEQQAEQQQPQEQQQQEEKPTKGVHGLAGEELLTVVFSVADMLGKEEARGLSACAGTSVTQVQQLFSRLRTSLRSTVQRMQSRAVRDTSPQDDQEEGGRGQQGDGDGGGAAAAAPGSRPGARPSLHAPDRHHAHPDQLHHHHSSRSHGQALGSPPAAGQGGGAASPSSHKGLDYSPEVEADQMALLQSLQLEDGSLNVAAPGAMAFVKFMQDACCFEVREAQLGTLSRTSPYALAPLMTGPLLDLLAAWLGDGEGSKQHTFVRAVLRAAQSLPIPRALLLQSRLLPAAIALARANPAKINPRTLHAAQTLLATWQATYEGGIPLPAALHRTIAPLAQLAARSGVRAVAALAAAGGTPAALANRAAAVPLGRKAQEAARQEAERKLAATAVPLGRQHQQQHQPQRRAGGAGGGTGAAPMSYDDIRRQREKQQAVELYKRMQQMQQGGGGGGGGVGGVLPLRASAQPPLTSLVALGAKRPAVGPAAGAVEEHPHQVALKRQALERAAAAARAAGAPPPPAAKPVVVKIEEEKEEVEEVQELSAADREAMMRHQQALLRRREVEAVARQACASAGATDLALVKEMVDAMLLERDPKAVRMAAARRRLLAQRAAEDLTAALAALQPSLPWHAPPGVHRSCYDALNPGEASQELRARPRYRPPPPAAPAVQAAAAREPPPSEQGPWRAAPQDTLAMPWMPSDPQEDEQQNEGVWRGGCRSPFLVRPPPNAKAKEPRPGRQPPAQPWQPAPRPALPAAAPAAAAAHPQPALADPRVTAAAANKTLNLAAAAAAPAQQPNAQQHPQTQQPAAAGAAQVVMLAPQPAAPAAPAPAAAAAAAPLDAAVLSSFQHLYAQLTQQQAPAPAPPPPAPPAQPPSSETLVAMLQSALAAQAPLQLQPQPQQQAQYHYPAVPQQTLIGAAAAPPAGGHQQQQIAYLPTAAGGMPVLLSMPQGHVLQLGHAPPAPPPSQHQLQQQHYQQAVQQYPHAYAAYAAPPTAQQWPPPAAAAPYPPPPHPQQHHHHHHQQHYYQQR